MKQLSREKYYDLLKKDPEEAEQRLNFVLDGFREVQNEKIKMGEDISDNEAMDLYLQREDLPNKIKELLIEVNKGATVTQDSDKMKILENANKQNIRTIEVESRSEYNYSMASSLFNEILRRVDAGEI
ncbi:hypothetical protein [Ezakiella peruensis]|uniref:hypothetical protein n=1 Tax=Ezakiella peruensis TaxID=1464038 RepID=UPI000C1B5764|nr:hypothetical protein [Ezakiella peruensis]